MRPSRYLPPCPGFRQGRPRRRNVPLRQIKMSLNRGPYRRSRRLLTDTGRENVNDVGGLPRKSFGRGQFGHEPTDEFAHSPLTIPALRRVRAILTAATPEHKPCRVPCTHDPDEALPCCNTWPIHLRM